MYTIDLVDLAFLRAHIDTPRLAATFERATPLPTKGHYPTSKVTLSLDEAEDAALVDHLSTLLCDIGLKPTSEPNETGLYIERLLDVFTDHGM